MRTTLTLDPDVAARIRAEIKGGKTSLKKAINDALRRGLNPTQTPRARPYRVKPCSSSFLPGIDPGKLNQLADELESMDFLRKHKRKP